MLQIHGVNKYNNLKILRHAFAVASVFKQTLTPVFEGQFYYYLLVVVYAARCIHPGKIGWPWNN